MESLSQPKSILDFLSIHQKQTCRECGGFVDCVRLTAPPIYQDGGIRFPRAARRDTCPDCQIKAASDDDERHRLQAEFDALRVMRIELGLGREEADRRVREALHMRGPRTTTLWSQLTHTDNPAVSAAVYTVLSDGVDLPREDEDELEAWGAAISTYPAFSLYCAEPPDFPGVAFVALAASIWYLKVPDAAVHLRWSPSSPTDYTMSVGSYEHFSSLKADERYELITVASTLFDRWMPRPGGRPRGSTAWKREEFLDEWPRARQKLRMMYGRKPSDGEIAAEMGIPKPSFDRYKKRFSTAPSN